MSCFLACFCFSKKQKRPRPAARVLIGHQFYGSYEQINTSPKADLSILEHPVVAKDFRDDSKKQPRQKVRKKVSFNLNVQTYDYEPIPDEYFFSDTENEIQDDQTRKEKTNQNVPSLSIYPSDHRYQNSSYDEDDDISLPESDSDGINDSQTENSEEEFATQSTEQSKYSVLKPIENLTQWKTAKAKTAVPKRAK